MIPEPITLGITGNVSVFNTAEFGPGAKTIRTSSTDETLETITVTDGKLTLAHEDVVKTGRRRSLFRIDVNFGNTNALTNGTVQPSKASAQLVVDTPAINAVGGSDREPVARFLLARILGFLSENATGAPDFDFSSNENVQRWVAGEP